MKKKIIALLFVSCMINGIYAQGSIFRMLLDETNLWDVSFTIKERYGQRFGVDVNIETVYTYLEGITSNKDFNSTNCFGGDLVVEEYQGGINNDILSFRWDGSATFDEYFGVYYDLNDGRKVEGISGSSESSTNEPLVTFNDTPDPKYKIIALNTRCGSEYSTFSIIIIERDLTVLSSLGMVNATPLSDDNPEELTFVNDYTVFPNPVRDDLQIRVTLEEEQTAEINLVSATGQYVRTVLSKTVLAADQYLFRVNTADLPAGVYSSVLTTDEGQHVKRVIVIK